MRDTDGIASRRRSCYASAPRGLETPLAEELAALGAEHIRKGPSGARFEGDLALAYRVCLWSRTASRVLLSLATFPAATPEALYAGVRGIDWAEHLRPDASLAVDASVTDSLITHSHFAALKVKDAVVDQFRERYGRRPSVQIERPDVRIHLQLRRDVARVSLDLAGEALHRRGYRTEAGPAPLKENLAAGILIVSGWPALCGQGAPFLDPMCGSGTLAIEAVLMAGDIAPGSYRSYFGFQGWLGHDALAWEALLREARERREAGRASIPAIRASDQSSEALRTLRRNLDRAGLGGLVEVQQQALAAVRPFGSQPGLVVVNPPYGERMQGAVPQVYTELGTVLKRCAGWRAAVFTGNRDLLHRLRLPVSHSTELYNGAIPCRLVLIEVSARGEGSPPPAQPRGVAQPEPAEVEAFADRLRKNLRRLGRWARRAGIDCYRVYDADLPQFALAIDLYGGERQWVHVQEYQAPPEVDRGRSTVRLAAALEQLRTVLAIAPDQVFLKLRQRQRGSAQYERLDACMDFKTVQEGGHRFLTNFSDYLDTGLFLDHRPTRALLGRLAPGKRFLNLFGYTGTATVYAARGGAAATTTVDMSQTYLDWARRNLELNGITGPQHRLVQADCLQWIDAELRNPERYDLIFLDPPTYSNSKRMREPFDVQRDHAALIDKLTRLLDRNGTLIFSTNRQSFRLDTGALRHLAIEDITAETLAPDFARPPPAHRCWKIGV